MCRFVGVDSMDAVVEPTRMSSRRPSKRHVVYLASVTGRFPGASEERSIAVMISNEFLDQIQTIVSRAGLSADSVAALRVAFPDHHFTHCLDDDIGVGIPPVRETDAFNLYLIDGSEHCLRFTRDLESATGVVLAEVSDDED
jgi:hypothetical protein